MSDYTARRDNGAEAIAGDSVSFHGAPAVSTSQLTVMALLATAGMLFAGFASAYLVRRAGTDWAPLPLPSVLIFSTVILAISSATMEASRWYLRRQLSAAAFLWAATTTLLGLAFLAGQLDAWRQLSAQGVYLPSGPHSSFFYVLTAAHGLHLAGGIVFLAYLLWRLPRRQQDRRDSRIQDTLRSCATYWHFVGGVWLLLYLLLTLY